ADLSLAYINVTRNEEMGDLHLTWDITDARLGTCTIRYRLSIGEDERVQVIHDLYFSDETVNLDFLSACTKYQIVLLPIKYTNVAHFSTQYFNLYITDKMVIQLLRVLLVTFFTFLPVNTASGQDCLPRSVQNINILSNTTLVWELDPFEPCDISNFYVDIWGGDAEEEYHFNITDNFLDVSFLGSCELWNFTITAVHYVVPGPASTLSTYVPLPPDADLSLAFVRYSFPDGLIAMEWDLANRTLGDCSVKYRLTLHDQDRDTMDDLYLDDTAILLTESLACTQYETILRAINMAYPMIEGPLRRLSIRLGARVQSAPTLKSINIQATSFNMTVALDGNRNKCPLMALLVDGGSYFNVSVPLQGLDSPDSAHVEVKSLLPNTLYYFHVSVQNNGGLSAPTLIAVQTLELSPN
ncbi:hypothetical protein NQ315_001358, partial [Exocentrus adspersus]